MMVNTTTLLKGWALLFLLTLQISIQAQTMLPIHEVAATEISVPVGSVPEVSFGYTVWHAGNPSSYVRTLTDGELRLRYVQYHVDDQFNWSFDETTGLWFRHQYLAPGHSGYFLYRSSLTDTEVDTLDGQDFDFDETSPHIFKGIDANTVAVIVKYKTPIGNFPGGSTLFSSLPYISGNDTVTASTNARFEYLMLYNTDTKTMVDTVPLWGLFPADDVDFRQYASSGPVSLWLGGHINALDVFTDTDAMVTGDSGSTVVALCSKVLNQVLFVDLEGNLLSRTGDMNFVYDSYEPDNHKVNDLGVIHGLQDITYFGAGRLSFNLLNNNAFGDFGEAVQYEANIPQAILTRTWVGTHPDSLQSDRLGNVIDLPNNWTMVNWGATIKTPQTVNFSLFESESRRTHDFNITSAGSESFGFNLLPASATDQLPDLDVDTVTIGGVLNLRVNDSATEYAFQVTADSIVTSTSNTWPAATDPVLWNAGIAYGPSGQFLFSPARLTTGITDNNGVTGVNIYPNPANQVIVVAANQAETACLLDLSGKEMTRVSFQGKQQVSFPVHDLTPGLYIIKIAGVNGGTANHKIVIAR